MEIIYSLSNLCANLLSCKGQNCSFPPLPEPLSSLPIMQRPSRGSPDPFKMAGITICQDYAGCRCQSEGPCRLWEVSAAFRALGPLPAALGRLPRWTLLMTRPHRINASLPVNSLSARAARQRTLADNEDRLRACRFLGGRGSKEMGEATPILPLCNGGASDLEALDGGRLY